jgi:hypothetical protein
MVIPKFRPPPYIPLLGHVIKIPLFIFFPPAVVFPKLFHYTPLQPQNIVYHTYPSSIIIVFDLQLLTCTKNERGWHMECPFIYLEGKWPAS